LRMSHAVSLLLPVRAPGRFAEIPFAPKHAKADWLLTMVVGPLRRGTREWVDTIASQILLRLSLARRTASNKCNLTQCRPLLPPRGSLRSFSVSLQRTWPARVCGPTHPTARRVTGLTHQSRGDCHSGPPTGNGLGRLSGFAPWPCILGETPHRLGRRAALDRCEVCAFAPRDAIGRRGRPAHFCPPPLEMRRNDALIPISTPPTLATTPSGCHSSVSWGTWTRGCAVAISCASRGGGAGENRIGARCPGRRARAAGRWGAGSRAGHARGGS